MSIRLVFKNGTYDTNLETIKKWSVKSAFFKTILEDCKLTSPEFENSNSEKESEKKEVEKKEIIMEAIDI